MGSVQPILYFMEISSATFDTFPTDHEKQ